MNAESRQALIEYLESKRFTLMVSVPALVFNHNLYKMHVTVSALGNVLVSDCGGFSIRVEGIKIPSSEFEDQLSVMEQVTVARHG